MDAIVKTVATVTELTTGAATVVPAAPPLRMAVAMTAVLGTKPTSELDIVAMVKTLHRKCVSMATNKYYIMEILFNSFFHS